MEGGAEAWSDGGRLRGGVGGLVGGGGGMLEGGGWRFDWFRPIGYNYVVIILARLHVARHYFNSNSTFLPVVRNFV